MIERQEDEAEVYRRTIPLSLGNQLLEAKIPIRIADCIFPTEGEYRIDLLVDGESIAHSRLTIRLEDEP
jgi:hypothetical protein